MQVSFVCMCTKDTYIYICIYICIRIYSYPKICLFINTTNICTLGLYKNSQKQKKNTRRLKVWHMQSGGKVRHKYDLLRKLKCKQNALIPNSHKYKENKQYLFEMATKKKTAQHKDRKTQTKTENAAQSKLVQIVWILFSAYAPKFRAAWKERPTAKWRAAAVSAWSVCTCKRQQQPDMLEGISYIAISCHTPYVMLHFLCGALPDFFLVFLPLAHTRRKVCQMQIFMFFILFEGGNLENMHLNFYTLALYKCDEEKNTLYSFWLSPLKDLRMHDLFAIYVAKNNKYLILWPSMSFKSHL